MVRNTTGGGGNKKFARKHAAGGASKAGNKLRVSEDEGELYALCTKNLGNNMFHAIATDGITYLAHIRGKFSGRGRRDNTVAGGVWVLIGLRPWTNDDQLGGNKKMQKCDLLEVYSEQDKTRLKDAVDEDWDVLNANDPTRINKEDDIHGEEIKWQNEKEAEKDKLLEQIKAGTTAKITLATDYKTIDAAKDEPFDMEVFIDDI
jgi:translation initiation factor IF-1